MEQRMGRQFVKVEKGLGPQGRVAVVRFDRGDNVNAFSHQAMREQWRSRNGGQGSAPAAPAKPAS